MKPLFNPQFFKGLLTILILFLIVKVLWFAVEILFLPSAGINHAEENAGNSLYYRVKLTPNQSRAPSKRQKVKKVVKSGASIDDIKLVALYNASDMTIVTVSYKGKTKVLSRGDDISGFILEGAGSNFALFSKDKKTYKVMLSKDNKKSKNTVSSSVAEPSAPNKKGSKKDGEVSDAGDHKIIDRSLLEHYTKNTKDIYRQIGIAEVKNGEKLEGFRLTFVRKGSDFEKLGVKRNDVIKSINGQAISSYNAVHGIYKNLPKANNISLVVQRGNEEMELEYEIE
jgi:general secretion pathway protein C